MKKLILSTILHWLVFSCTLQLLVDGTPRFDPTALFQNILIPVDAAVNSIIYRLRASDPTFDYPLIFTLRGESRIVSIDSLNCTRLNSLCQANVILRKRLESGRYYDFTVDVRSSRGASASMNCSFRATNATTPIAEIFPGAPTLLMVSEKARRNTELGVIIAKGNPVRTKGVLLELWGSPQFGLHQRLINDRDAQGTIILLGPLDYETRTVHYLTVLANDPYSEMDKDTRNIASWPLLVAVIDEQDTPPVFTLAPPTTTLSPALEPGDVILRVHAEDGDRGKPREIQYGLITENNPFARFFNISEDTGELRLVRPLNEILSIDHSGQPILVTVVAEEIRSNPQEAPSQSSTATLALIPPGITAGSPIFGANEYNALLDENSPTGTILDLPQAEIITQPGDVVTLDLLNNNGTFEITPSVVEGQSSFQIRVHDPKLLDYEMWHSVECYIIAKEFSSGNYTAKVKLKVLLNDVNDNDPEFTQNEYRGIVPENAPIGTSVLRVEAHDIDREPGSKIRYTRLMGPGSEFFTLDPVSGIIYVSQKLDAETNPILSFQVEAADEDGKGRTTISNVLIDVDDVNDEPPIFERHIYEFILDSDKTDFTYDAFIKAIDRDISLPNNEVHYELVTNVDNLILDEFTGKLQIRGKLDQSEVLVLKARAYDNGIPRLSDECEIRIYQPEGQSRKMVFIVPGDNPDRESVKSTLRALTGGRVTIDNIRPYTGHIPGATDVSQDSSSERSVVYATITYARDSVIDVNKIQDLLDKKQTTVVTNQKKEEVKSSGSNLLWVLILLILLALLAALILIMCCICQGCPLYVPPKRRKVVSSEIKKIVRGSGQGRESKSVQVAEWFGRKEAWTPEHVMVDNEAESLRRHEVERGSDREEMRRTIHRQQQIQREPSREQLYIREGNTDILRLITRGNEPQPQRPVTLVAEQAYMTDTGKDILMRRFIDQQQSEMPKTHVILPNSINKLQTEHELLEASLRQQNALLHQLLVERERDLRLETQSLPAGTQTDQDIGTQTEPEYLRPPKRRVRSDNDASDDSDDEVIIFRTRGRRKRSDKSHIRRKIKTPIQEEPEVEIIEKPPKEKKLKSRALQSIKQTRTSELRQKKATEDLRTRSAIRKEILREISASLERSDSDQSYEEKKEIENIPEYYSEDSLEEISPRSEEKSSSTKQKYSSETDLRMETSQSQSKDTVRSQSQFDLSKIKEEKKQSSSKTKPLPPTKKTARYMEWYNKKKGKSDDSEKTGKKVTTAKTKASKISDSSKIKTESKKDEVVKEITKKVEGSRFMKDTESSSKKKVDDKKTVIGPDHPLLQHSEYRYEAPYPMIRRNEEDVDSGIALSRPAITEKKSVFTIAYNDMHTTQLLPDTTSPPL